MAFFSHFRPCEKAAPYAEHNGGKEYDIATGRQVCTEPH